MAWRPTALGVDVQGRTVYLALVERRGSEVVVRRLLEASMPDATPDDAQPVIAAIVGRAVRDEGLEADRLVLGLPATTAIVRRLHVPVVGERKVMQALAFAIEPLIPYAAEDIFVDGLTIATDAGGTDLLAFAVTRDTVIPMAQHLERAGVAPEIVTPDLVALLGALPPPVDAHAREAVLYVRGTRGFFAARDGDRFIEFRPLAGSLGGTGLHRDARQSLVALLDAGAPLARVLLIGDAHALMDLTDGLDVPVERGELHLPATLPEAVAAGVGDARPWDVAIALAAQGVGRTGPPVNFHRAALSRTHLAAWLAPVRRTAVLAACTLLVYTASLFTQRVALRSQRDGLRRGIQHQFAAALPGVTGAEDARRRVQETRAAHDDLAPFVRPGPEVIEVLAACDAAMRGVPKVRVSSLTISGDVLRLTGEVPNFQAVTLLRNALAASPMLADVQTARAGEGRSTGSTGFKLNARIRAGGSLAAVQLPAPDQLPPAPAPVAETSEPAPAPPAIRADNQPETAAVAGAVMEEQTLFAPGSRPAPPAPPADDLFSPGAGPDPAAPSSNRPNVFGAKGG